MRILQIVPYFAPAYAYGGPPETVHKLSKALAERGNKVTVLTTDALNSTERQRVRNETDGLEIHYLRNLSNYLAWHHQIFLPLGTSRFLRSQLGSFDIIHVHMFRTYQNVVARRYSRGARIPYVFSAHGSVPLITRKIMAKQLFDRIAGHGFLEDATRLIAVSNAETRQYEAMGVPNPKIVVIPNGIDAEQYSILPPRGSFSRRYGLEGKKLITYVGRLNSRKGLDTLLQSVRDLTTVHDDVVLVLVGPDDGYRGQVERITKRLGLETHVLLTGLITLPSKLEVLVDSDVVVYPGAFEIFGLVPFEALLCGRPVVVANDSGCGEIVERAKAGITFRVGDSQSLASAISRALTCDDDIVEMTQRGRKYTLEQLDWVRIAKQVEDCYRAALDQGTT